MTTWDPGDYARHSSVQYGFAEEAIRRLEVRGDEAVLDLGCGDGKITAQLALKVPRGKVVGIDASPEMIAFARQEHPRTRYHNLDFALMEAQALAFEAEFDLVFSNSAMHWVLDHRPVLAGVARGLKPGGQVRLQMAGKGNLAALAPAVIKVLGNPRWQGKFTNVRLAMGLYDAQEYRDLLLKAGLRPTRVELVRREIIHHDQTAMIGWMRTTWMFFLASLSPEQRDEFIAAVMDAYLEAHPSDPQGKIAVPSMRLEVEAEKPVVNGEKIVQQPHDEKEP